MPPQELCQRCRRHNVVHLVPNRHKSLTKVVELGLASEVLRIPTCSLCQVINHAFQQRRTRTHNRTYYLYPFYTSQAHAYKWVYSPRLRNITETVSFIIIDDQELDALRRNELWPLRDSVLNTCWISPLPIVSSPPEAGFYARRLSSSVDFDIVKEWFNFCKVHHHRTCRPVQTPPRRVSHPIKLIDCETRRVTTESLGQSYLALSYVWGSNPGSGFNNRTHLPSSLPRTIEDAIRATKMSGFRYLWIDRYCIDQSDTNEKMAQIGQMDLIYGNAFCTIVASVGDNPSIGLPGVSSWLREPQVYSTVRSGRIYTPVPRVPLTDIKASVWNSRGWTFQEALLSQRCMAFCLDQVYFTCGGMSCRDVIDIPLTAMHRKDLDRFSAWNVDWNDSYNYTRLDTRLFRVITSVQFPLPESFKLIQTYTRRALTQSSDILEGILGVFERLQTVYQEFSHFHGIIIVPDITLLDCGTARQSTRTEELLTGLCWDVDKGAKCSEGENRRPGFPSWSWTGWLSPITAPTEYDGYISNSYGLIISVEDSDGSLINWEGYCSSKKDNGEVLNARPRLYIKGLFVEVSLHYSTADPHSSDKPVHDQNSGWQAVIYRQEEPIAFANFTLTRQVGDDQQPLYRKLTTLKWPGLILGLRYGTVDGGHNKRFHNGSYSRLIVMVLNMELGLAERLGLAVFEGDINLDSVPTQMRSVILV